MRQATLPAPGPLSNGIRLRVEAAKSISIQEVNAMRTPGGKTTSAKTLSDFFTACVSALSGLYDVTAPVVSGAVASAATTIKISFTEAVGMDQTVTPAAAAFAISGDTVTSVAWGTAGDAGKLILTGTGFAAAETLSYTKPATNALRDKAGNQMATNAAIVLS